MLWQNAFQQIPSKDHRRFKKFTVAFRDLKSYCKVTLKQKFQI